MTTCGLDYFGADGNDYSKLRAERVFVLLLCNEMFRSPRWYFASTFCTTVHNQKQSRNSMYIATTSVVPIYVCTTYLNGTKSCMMSSPLFDLNQNRCILPEYCPQNYSILPDWNRPRRNYPSFPPHNTVPDRFRKAINISRKSNKIYKKMSWSENSQTLTESWPSMDIPQSSQSDVMTSILRTWLAKIVWKRSSRTRPNNACVLQAAIFGSPLFFCCLKILLFDASLSHKMIDIWSSFLCLR